jgi:ornithine cyclodeaminase/alanine dehydrogenase-like protein (mu-crystallin family)
MRTLTENDVRSRLDPERLISALEDAFRNRYPDTLIPVRTQMKLADGIFLMMPCYDRTGRALGVKLVMVVNDPPTPDQKLHATFLLLDSATGHPDLSMPAAYLTDTRTAAASAVATKYLAREDVRVLGVFGTGRQARAHLKVLRLVRPFTHFLVSGLEPGYSREFAQEMSRELNAPVESVYSRACAAESDVLCTCTTSPTPLFDGQMLRPGTHLNLVGSFQPQTREVDDITIQRSRVVVDTYEGALSEPGDLLIPISKGLIGRSHVLADLHELVGRKKAIRTRPDDITLFKSVGFALEDLVAAELVASGKST